MQRPSPLIILTFLSALALADLLACSGPLAGQ